MDTPTAVKYILNNNMAFGQIHTVVESTDDEGRISFDISYVQNINDLDAGAVDFDINFRNNKEYGKAYLIIVNDFNKQVTTLVYNTGILSTNEGKVKFIEENNHRIFLLPKGGVAVTDSNTTI